MVFPLASLRDTFPRKRGKGFVSVVFYPFFCSGALWLSFRVRVSP